MLEVMCARILMFKNRDYQFFCFFLWFSQTVFFWSHLVYKAFDSDKGLSSAPLNQTPVPSCHHWNSVIVRAYLCIVCENV